MTTEHELFDLEIDLFLEAIYRLYRHDFRRYARPTLRRRLAQALGALGEASLSQLQHRVLREPALLAQVLRFLTVQVSELFRDPGFYLALRTQVVPLLRTYPFIRIWHTGCSTGEEVYSMAILLIEEDLHSRCRIYATDINEAVLRKARDGIFPLNKMQEYTQSYLRSGGKRAFSEYYTAAYGSAIFAAALRENIVFSQHNLVMDRSFNEFHVILCRNVLIYFNERLQARVHDLLYDSLVKFGVLGLGHNESTHFSPHEHSYAELEHGTRLYRRIA